MWIIYYIFNTFFRPKLKWIWFNNLSNSVPRSLNLLQRSNFCTTMFILSPVDRYLHFIFKIMKYSWNRSWFCRNFLYPRSLVNWLPLPCLQPRNWSKAAIPSSNYFFYSKKISWKLISNSNFFFREMQYVFGEYLGLHFHSLLRTESKYYDLVAILERLRMYKYNPMNMVRTIFSQYATDAEGRLSVRRHEYSLM